MSTTEKEVQDDITIVSPQGRLTGIELEEFENELNSFKGKKIILDLRDLEYISSQGISVLLMTFRGIKAINAKMIVANPRGHVRKLLELIHFSSFVPVTQSLDEAKRMMEE